MSEDLLKKEKLFYKKRDAVQKALDKAREQHTNFLAKVETSFARINILESEMVALYNETIKELEDAITPKG